MGTLIVATSAAAADAVARSLGLSHGSWRYTRFADDLDGVQGDVVLVESEGAWADSFFEETRGVAKRLAAEGRINLLRVPLSQV